MSLKYDEIVRADAILNMHKNFIKTILDEITTHGEDNSMTVLAMISASLMMTIEQVDKSFDTNILKTMIYGSLEELKK